MKSHSCLRLPGADVHVSIRIQEGDFSTADEYRALRTRMGGSVGAVVNFIGLVRDRQADSDVSSLAIEHYPGMTEKSMTTIVESAARRWPLDDVTIVHRVGELAACEQIVFVQVASAHRAAAFAACEFLMDYLKTDAVFWKREVTSDGTSWLEASSEDKLRVRGWKAPDPSEES